MGMSWLDYHFFHQIQWFLADDKALNVSQCFLLVFPPLLHWNNFRNILELIEDIYIILKNVQYPIWYQSCMVDVIQRFNQLN